MAYNIPCGPSQPPFFNDNMANSQFYQDDLMDIQSSWMQNIDPLLRSQSQDSLQSWQSQQQPLQRFIAQPERNLFTAPSFPNPSQAFLRGVPRPTIPISTLPRAPHARMVSPAPSHLTSTCSSARSPGGPGGDNEWYQDPGYYSPQSQDDFAFSNAASQLSQGFPDLWSGQHQEVFPQLPNFNPNCVNLSQVQGFPDPQEVTFDADEGYVEMEMKNDYTIEVDAQTIKTEGTLQAYRYPSDEGIGASIKDEGSPHNTSIIQVEPVDGSDIDADGDAEDVIIAEPASDTEYSPKSSRTRKRRASKVTPFPPSTKRGRIVKSLPKSKSTSACKVCDHAPFKDAAALQRHIASSHTRAFVCVFDFAGCQSTFASKNEWKRHVSSQHLNLHAWVCDIGACAKVQSHLSRDEESVLKGSEFNRKDLFTQHLRRMHAPHSVKRMNKKNPEWEERLKELQVSCLRVKREAPKRLACPLDVCDGIFEGQACWDERMEHVGKHLEKAGQSFGKDSLVVRQVDDELLVGWALREGIIERKVSGGFRLCSMAGGRRDDEDAEGEEE